jgi:hypothetical protein
MTKEDGMEGPGLFTRRYLDDFTVSQYIITRVDTKLQSKSMYVGIPEFDS